MNGDEEEESAANKREKSAADLNHKHTRAAPILSGVKRDFFGRVINDIRPVSAGGLAKPEEATKVDEPRVWVSFREGYSNAVRRPVTLRELLESF